MTSEKLELNRRRFLHNASQLAAFAAMTPILLASSSGYLPGISVCCYTLYGSYSDRPLNFKAGEVIARRMAVFLVEVTPQQTSRLAQSCKIEEQGGFSS